jgi:hypothetical protein
MVNVDKEKLYVGHTTELGRRKATYKNGFNNKHAVKKLPAEIREEIVSGVSNKEEFFYVPVVVVPAKFFETKDELKKFLKGIEDVILDSIEPSEKDIYYNRAGTRFFQAPPVQSNPLSFKGFFWKSERSAASYCGLSRPVINSYTLAGVFTRLPSWERGASFKTPPTDPLLKAALVKEIRESAGRF